MFTGCPLPVHCFCFVSEWTAVVLNVNSCVFPFSSFPSLNTVNKCNTFCQCHWGGQELNKIPQSILFGTDWSSEINIFYEAIILKRIPSTTMLRLLWSLKKWCFFFIWNVIFLYQNILLRTQHVQGNKDLWSKMRFSLQNNSSFQFLEGIEWKEHQPFVTIAISGKQFTRNSQKVNYLRWEWFWQLPDINQQQYMNVCNLYLI